MNCQRIKNIKAPQGTLLCPTHVDNKEKTGFQKYIFTDYGTRQNLSKSS